MLINLRLPGAATKIERSACPAVFDVFRIVARLPPLRHAFAARRCLSFQPFALCFLPFALPASLFPKPFFMLK